MMTAVQVVHQAEVPLQEQAAHQEAVVQAAQAVLQAVVHRQAALHREVVQVLQDQAEAHREVLLRVQAVHQVVVRVVHQEVAQEVLHPDIQEKQTQEISNYHIMLQQGMKTWMPILEGHVRMS